MLASNPVAPRSRYKAAMIHLSFDQDWAPAWATEALIRHVVDAKQVGTLFVTNACSSLDLARASGFELGWHPNFLPGSSHGESIDEVLDFMTALVPEAVGVRAHCLVRGTPYMVAYRDRGLRYEASDLMDGVDGLEPFRSWTGLWRLPIWLEDDVSLERGLRFFFTESELAGEGLQVVNIHPVLHALNCTELAQYQDLKAHLAKTGVSLTQATQEDFASFVQSDRPGVRDLLDELLGHMQRHEERAGGCLKDLAI